MCLEFQILCSPMKTCLIAKLQAIPQFLDKAKLGHMLYPLVMTNSLPWFFDGPNRNRWFSMLVIIKEVIPSGYDIHSSPWFFHGP